MEEVGEGGGRLGDEVGGRCERGWGSEGEEKVLGERRGGNKRLKGE